jgi:glutathione peroxidase
MRTLSILLAIAGCQTLAMSASPSDPKKTIYDFTMTDIDGHKIPLKKYKGKVLLIVNVASKCGLTPQYKGLQALYEEKKKEGVVILGFPANNFNGQEPGSETEIKEFCSTNYGVTFPMFSKISVKGDDQAELYKWLISNSDRPTADIEWNFAKFVIGKDGKVFRRLTPRDTPDSEAVRKALEEAQAAK